jgi:uncharacterized protein
MSEKIIYGREDEVTLIQQYATSKTSQMIAVIGRRRIGKTYLIRRSLAGKIDFEMTGVKNTTNRENLNNFLATLDEYASIPVLSSAPSNWIEAFFLLRKYLSNKKPKEKKVIFIDEVPWLSTQKSGFVEALAHFWNSWAEGNNVLLVLCGSATSWMMKHIVRGRGGLHHRLHQTIHLEPFTLKQTQQMLKGMKIKAKPIEIAELYMILGGVPYYLSLLEKQYSITQNIENLFFSKNGKLAKEFDELFYSLYDNPIRYLDVMKILAGKWSGMTRLEIASKYSVNDGGGLSAVLEDLAMSGFISKSEPFGKSVKESLYRVCDPFILFHTKYLLRKGNKSMEDIVKSASYNAWRGYAFENICSLHITQIKKAIKISRMSTSISSFYHKGSTTMNGAQVDLIINRSDNYIHLCEAKFYTTAFTIDKKTVKGWEEKIAVFEAVTKSNKNVYITYITANGLIENENYHSIVDFDIRLEDLFL